MILFSIVNETAMCNCSDGYTGEYCEFSRKLILTTQHTCVVKALCMRNEDDINTAHDMKSICRAALLNDNAPDSELYRTRVRVFGEQQFLLTTLVIVRVDGVAL